MGEKKKIIFSGIQPSGNLHIGNYLGAIKQWTKIQNDSSAIAASKATLCPSAAPLSGAEEGSNLIDSEIAASSRQNIGTPRNDNHREKDILYWSYDLLFCIVDLHAITVPQDPQVLREKILELAGLYIACGIDPKKSKIFVQSQNPDHAYLTWIFDCITPMGWLERMTQYKAKTMKNVICNTKKQEKSELMGLLNYPVLQASDILLYDTDIVPVGEDQVQHVELARDIGKKFNSRFGETFRLTKALVDKKTARIMSLADPKSKMSKSDSNQAGTINLLDDLDLIRRKIARAVTDSNPTVDGQKYRSENYEPDGVSNLITIYSSFENIAFSEALEFLQDKSYSEFKKIVSEAVCERVGEIQRRYKEISSERQYLNSVLGEGLVWAKEKSSAKIKQVKEKIGLGY